MKLSTFVFAPFCIGCLVTASRPAPKPIHSNDEIHFVIGPEAISPRSQNMKVPITPVQVLPPPAREMAPSPFYLRRPSVSDDLRRGSYPEESKQRKAGENSQLKSLKLQASADRKRPSEATVSYLPYTSETAPESMYTRKESRESHHSQYSQPAHTHDYQVQEVPMMTPARIPSPLKAQLNSDSTISILQCGDFMCHNCYTAFVNPHKGCLPRERR